uniref:Secreted protein n=1 Tax=Streptomyces sp. NBC_00008 TaxID=2903610 RepID=A0AAU2VXY6_9ACTN
MRRGLVHGLAWSLATGAAVTLSWWGVHTVMAGTAYDPPRAVPISASARATTETLSSSTHRPEPSPSPSPGADRTASAPKPSVTPVSPSRSHTPAGTPRPAAPATPAGTARSYATDGGRVVFELGADSAKLVSATPEQGWSMRVWTEPAWIRVNFARDDGTTVSVFCTWNGYPPKVEIVT